MASRHVATMSRLWSAGRSAVYSTAAIRTALVALALGIAAPAAHADNSDEKPRQPDANVQRTAQSLPPARVILPAPWEPAASAHPAAAPAVSTERK